MATELGQAYVQILPSAKGITANIEKTIGGDITGSAKSLGQSFGSHFVSAIKGVVAASGVSIGAMVAKSISEGGELQQNLGGTEAVFGQFGANVQKIAQDAYANMGLSASQYMATANKMGSLFQGSGLQQQQALNLTTKAMQRAADVASVMGIDTSWAMESIAGAAKGNYTMMDNLGVAMNATSIQAYALQKGINFDWNTATQAQKAEIAMQMFFERTSQYAGNFARESQATLTGSFSAVKASLSNVLGNLALGEDIRPSLEALGQATSDFLLNNFLPMVGNTLSGLPGVIRGFITAAAPQFQEAGRQLLESLGISLSDFSGITAQVQTNMQPVVNSVKTSFGQIPTALEPVKTAMGDFITIVGESLAQMDFSGISALVDTLLPSLSAGFETFWTIVEPAVKAVAESFVGLWNSLQPLISTIAGVLQPVFEVLGAFLGGVFKGVLNFVKMLFDGIKIAVDLLSPVISILAGVFEKLSPIFQIVGEKIGELIGFFGSMGGAATSLKGFIQNAWTNIKNAIATAKEAIGSAINGIKGFFQAVADKGASIKAVLSTAWDGIKGAISTAKNAIGGFIDGIKNFFGSLGEKGQSLLNTVKGAWDGIINAISDAVSRIGEFVESIIGTITSIGDIDLFEIGSSIINSLLDGLKNAFNAVKDFIGGIGDWIVKHKGPPSYDRRMLIPAGRAIMDGLNQGLVDNYKNVQSTISGVGDSLMEDFQTALPDISQRVAIQGATQSSALSTPSSEETSAMASQGKQPLSLQLNIGGQSFRAFVEDITRMQDRQANLQMRYE